MKSITFKMELSIGEKMTSNIASELEQSKNILKVLL